MLASVDGMLDPERNSVHSVNRRSRQPSASSTRAAQSLLLHPLTTTTSSSSHHNNNNNIRDADTSQSTINSATTTKSVSLNTTTSATAATAASVPSTIEPDLSGVHSLHTQVQQSVCSLQQTTSDLLAAQQANLIQEFNYRHSQLETQLQTERARVAAGSKDWRARVQQLQAALHLSQHNNARLQAQHQQLSLQCARLQQHDRVSELDREFLIRKLSDAHRLQGRLVLRIQYCELNHSMSPYQFIASEKDASATGGQQHPQMLLPSDDSTDDLLPSRLHSAAQRYNSRARNGGTATAAGAAAARQHTHDADSSSHEQSTTLVSFESPLSAAAPVCTDDPSLTFMTALQSQDSNDAKSSSNPQSKNASRTINSASQLMSNAVPSLHPSAQIASQKRSAMSNAPLLALHQQQHQHQHSHSQHSHSPEQRQQQQYITMAHATHSTLARPSTQQHLPAALAAGARRPQTQANGRAGTSPQHQQQQHSSFSSSPHSPKAIVVDALSRNASLRDQQILHAYKQELLETRRHCEYLETEQRSAATETNRLLRLFKQCVAEQQLAASLAAPHLVSTTTTQTTNSSSNNGHNNNNSTGLELMRPRTAAAIQHAIASGSMRQLSVADRELILRNFLSNDEVMRQLFLQLKQKPAESLNTTTEI